MVFAKREPVFFQYFLVAANTNGGLFIILLPTANETGICNIVVADYVANHLFVSILIIPNNAIAILYFGTYYNSGNSMQLSILNDFVKNGFVTKIIIEYKNCEI